MAASDREMSQCYELLIATHPIHILIRNPSTPIGPCNPDMGRGKDENPSTKPNQSICKPPNLKQYSFHFLSLSPSLLPPCLAAPDHSFPNRNLIVARPGGVTIVLPSHLYLSCICFCICQHCQVVVRDDSGPICREMITPLLAPWMPVSKTTQTPF